MHRNGIRTVDVAVIGGGPSGLQTASILASNGLSVTLFDQRAKIGSDVVCSGVVSTEAFERYDLPKEAIVGSIKEAELLSPNKTLLPYTHPETAAYVVDRAVFDTKLAEGAAKNGAKIVLNTRVTELEHHNGFIEARYRTLNSTGSLKAQVAVIATGISFRLQTMLGLGRPRKILKGSQIETDAGDIERLRVYFGNGISSGFFGWALPIDNSRVRIGVMTAANPYSGLGGILSDLGLVSNGSAVKKRGIAFGPIPKSYTDRVLVVGEAAGQIKTTTGGGIYYGLQGGEIAAGAVKAAFEAGDFGEKTLSVYEREWKSSMGKEIAAGQYFHNFYSKLDDDSIDMLFEAAGKDRLLSFIAEQGRFDWHKNTVVRVLKSPNLRKVLMRKLLLKAVGMG